MVGHFPLMFVKLWLALILYFNGVNNIISLAYTKCSSVSLLEPLQKNLSNAETYSKPCCKRVVKHSI